MKDNKTIALFLDTATKALAIGAIYGEEKDNIVLKDPKKALETTHLGIQALSKKLGFSLADVDSYYCLLGPGSNTGIRLGLTIPRTVYAFNQNIKLYGIDTLKLYLAYDRTKKAVLSDRNGNLFLAYYEENSYFFTRIDKKDIDEKIPSGTEIIVEKEDAMAIEELQGRNLHPISVIELMMEKKDIFEDYSSREEDYLPSYITTL